VSVGNLAGRLHLEALGIDLALAEIYAGTRASG